MVENGANCVEAAVDQRARIGAIVLDASLRVGAIRVQCALMRNRTTGSYGITGRPLRADAAIRSTKIDTIRARVTGMIVAFVDVQTVFRPSYESVAASGWQMNFRFIYPEFKSINLV